MFLNKLPLSLRLEKVSSNKVENDSRCVYSWDCSMHACCLICTQIQLYIPMHVWTDNHTPFILYIFKCSEFPFFFWIWNNFWKINLHTGILGFLFGFFFTIVLYLLTPWCDTCAVFDMQVCPCVFPCKIYLSNIIACWQGESSPSGLLDFGLQLQQSAWNLLQKCFFLNIIVWKFCLYFIFKVWKHCRLLLLIFLYKK